MVRTLKLSPEVHTLAVPPTSAVVTSCVDEETVFTIAKDPSVVLYTRSQTATDAVVKFAPEATNVVAPDPDVQVPVYCTGSVDTLNGAPYTTFLS